MSRSATSDPQAERDARFDDAANVARNAAEIMLSVIHHLTGTYQRSSSAAGSTVSMEIISQTAAALSELEEEHDLWNYGLLNFESTTDRVGKTIAFVIDQLGSGIWSNEEAYMTKEYAMNTVIDAVTAELEERDNPF